MYTTTAFLTLLTTISATSTPLAPIIASPPHNSSSALSSTTSTCQPGSGTPGGFYWCSDPNFSDSGYFGCGWREPTETCHPFNIPYYMVVAEYVGWHARKSIGPDWGGYCQFYGDLNCKGPVMDIKMGENVYRLECPGSPSIEGIEGHSMKCFKK